MMRPEHTARSFACTDRSPAAWSDAGALPRSYPGRAQLRRRRMPLPAPDSGGEQLRPQRGEAHRAERERLAVEVGQTRIRSPALAPRGSGLHPQLRADLEGERLARDAEITVDFEAGEVGLDHREVLEELTRQRGR